ncbi:Sarcoglycan complex subunit protein [Trinorchestia longiramus]|nr:Sarcoglycan complex subunit protein [Trinorchestia longiramus]
MPGPLTDCTYVRGKGEVGVEGLPEGCRPQLDFGGHTGDAAIVLGGQQVRLAAWRKKLLYVLLAVLLCMAVANALTTLWLLSRMSFNTRGLGSLHVEVEGVRLLGRSWLDETTNTRSIQSRQGRRLSLYGYHNTSLYALDDNGHPLTALVLGRS